LQTRGGGTGGGKRERENEREKGGEEGRPIMKRGGKIDGNNGEIFRGLRIPSVKIPVGYCFGRERIQPLLKLLHVFVPSLIVWPFFAFE
jgi:hypothetical protein